VGFRSHVMRGYCTAGVLTSSLSVTGVTNFDCDTPQYFSITFGKHAITAPSTTTLWNRLHTHRGHSDLGGNHRGSIFRKRIGAALWRARQYPEDLTLTWGVRSSASKSIRSAEASLEREVSTYIGQMPFLWIGIPDSASPKSDRAYLELNSIALLSNFEKPPIDPPPPNWLGRQSGERTIRESGLWNTNHVEKPYDPMFVQKLGASCSTKELIPKGCDLFGIKITALR